MISHGADHCDDDGVGGEEDARPLVSCDTFVAMADVTQTGEVRGSTKNPKKIYLSTFHSGYFWQELRQTQRRGSRSSFLSF